MLKGWLNNVFQRIWGLQMGQCSRLEFLQLRAASLGLIMNPEHLEKVVSLASEECHNIQDELVALLDQLGPSALGVTREPLSQRPQCISVFRA